MSRWQVEEEVTARLEEAGVPTPDVDARLLLDVVEERFGTLAGCPAGVLDAMVERRAARVPLQVVLGRTTFRWVDLEIVPGVFVPRPETEVVAGLAIDACAGIDRPVVAEPCTGTGAITCALLAEVPGVTVLASDPSAAAVALAGRNVDAVLVGRSSPPTHRPTPDASVVLEQGHLLAPFERLETGDKPVHGRLDVLVANPPYLPTGDLGSMEPEVADHDPHDALFGGDEGHELVDELLGLAATWLRSGGTVVVEIDDRRGRDARAAAEAAGLVGVTIAPDLTGRDRAVVAQRR